MIVVPVLKELRDQMEGVRAAELERALRRLRHLNPDDRAQLDHFSHTLLNKFLHQPTIALKEAARAGREYGLVEADRKSTRLNSSHSQISYAVFCLKKKKVERHTPCSDRRCNNSH